MDAVCLSGWLIDCVMRSSFFSGLALAHQLYMSVVALGFDKKGIQALQLALDNINNMHNTPSGEEDKKTRLPKHLEWTTSKKKTKTERHEERVLSLSSLYIHAQLYKARGKWSVCVGILCIYIQVSTHLHVSLSLIYTWFGYVAPQVSFPRWGVKPSCQRAWISHVRTFFWRLPGRHIYAIESWVYRCLYLCIDEYVCTTSVYSSSAMGVGVYESTPEKTRSCWRPIDIWTYICMCMDLSLQRGGRYLDGWRVHHQHVQGLSGNTSAHMCKICYDDRAPDVEEDDEPHALVSSSLTAGEYWKGR